MTTLTSFIGAQAQFNATFAPTTIHGTSIYRWEGSSERVPIYIRSAEYNVGVPHERKWWNYINFHGEGTAQIRVYNDGAFISQCTLVATEGAEKPRRINLPNGTKGYGLSFELVGDYNLRGIELAFNNMPNPKGA